MSIFRFCFLFFFLLHFSPTNAQTDTSFSADMLIIDSTVLREPYLVVDTEPKFPGNVFALSKFMRDSIFYPEYELANKIGGKVLVSMVINRQGEIEGIGLKENRTGSEALADEVIRVVKKMPKWEPGKVKNKTVSTHIILIFQFDPEDIYWSKKNRKRKRNH